MALIIYLIFIGAAVFMMYYLPIIAKDLQILKEQNEKVISLLEERNKHFRKDE